MNVFLEISGAVLFMVAGWCLGYQFGTAPLSGEAASPVSDSGELLTAEERNNLSAFLSRELVKTPAMDLPGAWEASILLDADYRLERLQNDLNGKCRVAPIRSLIAARLRELSKV